MSSSLTNLRTELDHVDDQIVVMIKKRLQIAMAIADVKNNESTAPLTDHVREETILHRLKGGSTQSLVKEAIDQVFSQLFALSKTMRLMHRVTHCPYNVITIIGDGLIGRSLYNIIDSKKRLDTIVRIVNHEWSMDDIRGAQLIIIATPIDDVSDIAHRIVQYHQTLHAETTIIDVASVKTEIFQSFAKLTAQYPSLHLITTHPMGGRQEQGKRAACLSLFAGRPWIICADKKDNQVFVLLEQFIEFCGSSPVYLDAIVHDKYAAYVSHMPGIISKLLLDYVTERKQESLDIAGSGFELMTRIGRTENVRMRKQISLSNQKEINIIITDFANYMLCHLNPWNS